MNVYGVCCTLHFLVYVRVCTRIFKWCSIYIFGVDFALSVLYSKAMRRTRFVELMTE